jgi:CheY-like chemotaxis protein
MFLPPASEQAQAVGPAGALSQLPRGRGESILVCEDDEDVRDFSTATLRELGYEVHEASDADHALSLLRQGDKVDLLFTDVVLPGSTNGAELAREARKLRPGLKVLLTTGYARSALDDADMQPALELISKPFSVERLAVRLRQLLD